MTGEGWSSDVYITPVPGHKDANVARTIAEKLAQELMFPVAITAGIHSDHLQSEELSKIVLYCDNLTKTALEALRQSSLSRKYDEDQTV